MLEKLFEKLGHEYDIIIKHKGVGVHTLNLCEFDLEFSSPRLEVFKEGEVGHLNFEPRFISNLSTREAFKRRDFTLNAIGVFFGVSGADDEFSIVDPYHGIEALEKKELRHISNDFFLDPVRFLRLIRFQNKFNFTIDKELESMVGNFNLSKLGLFHFYQEFKKSNTIFFFKIFFELIERYEISLNQEISNLSFLQDTKDILTKDRGELFFAFQSFSIEQKKVLVDSFNLKKKLFNGYLKTYEVIKKFHQDNKIDQDVIETFEIVKSSNLAVTLGLGDCLKYKDFLTLTKDKPSFKNQSEKKNYYHSLIVSLNGQKCPK